MRKLILIVGAVMLFAVAAHAQKLTTTQPTVLCDPTTITNCAPVSATNGPSVTVASVTASANANQAAASSDTVMCATDIGCRPGSAISVTTTMQNGATANGNGTVLAVDGMGSAIVTVICSVSCATTQVIFEAQNDGSNFVSVNATQSGTTTPPTSTYTLSGTTAVAFQVPVAGFKQLRARILNYSSGTITAVGTTVPIDFNSRTINSNLYAAGTAVDTNSGNKSAATIRFVQATDQPQLTLPTKVDGTGNTFPATQSGTWTMQPGNTANTTPWLFVLRDAAGNARGANVDANNNLGIVLPAETTKVIGSVRNVDGSGNIQPSGDTSGRALFTQIGSGGFAAGSLNSAIPDPCLYTAKTAYPISISTATTTVVQAASSSNKFRICSMFLFASAAENVALVEDATGSCASPDAGMMGGTTAATGINLAANQGWTLGSGLATIAQTASTNVNVCLITSSTAQLSGTIMGVLAP